MFTGIVREIGTIKTISSQDEMTILAIEAPKLSKDKKEGDSISIDGVCLTITGLETLKFEAEIMPETLNKTIIGNYKKGTQVNLENPSKIGDTLDGHLVTGHVDFTGEVMNITPQKRSKNITIKIPENSRKYFALKGSVAVNGVSLTISDIDINSFTVSLIPETLNNTNLGILKPGDSVNLEIDLIIRYLESLLNQKEQEISYDFLKERGFI